MMIKRKWFLSFAFPTFLVVMSMFSLWADDSSSFLFFSFSLYAASLPWSLIFPFFMSHPSDFLLYQSYFIFAGWFFCSINVFVFMLISKKIRKWLKYFLSLLMLFGVFLFFRPTPPQEIGVLNDVKFSIDQEKMTVDVVLLGQFNKIKSIHVEKESNLIIVHVDTCSVLCFNLFRYKKLTNQDSISFSIKETKKVLIKTANGMELVWEETKQ